MLVTQVVPREVFQQVAIGASSTQSAAFAATTKKITLSADQDCYVALGTNPTATTGAGSFLVPAHVLVTFGVEPGEKLAVIESGSAGKLSIAEGRQLP